MITKVSSNQKCGRERMLNGAFLKSLRIYEWRKNVSVFYRNTVRFMKSVLKMNNVFAVAF